MKSEAQFILVPLAVGAALGFVMAPPLSAVGVTMMGAYMTFVLVLFTCLFAVDCNS